MDFQLKGVFPSESDLYLTCNRYSLALQTRELTKAEESGIRETLSNTSLRGIQDKYFFVFSEHVTQSYHLMYIPALGIHI